MLPTILLGDTARVLGGSAATAVGATGIGPSIETLRMHPELVDKAAAVPDGDLLLDSRRAGRRPVVR